MSRAARTRELQQVLQAGPEVRMAFLFGSTARGTEHPGSDVDIAFLPANPDITLAEELALQARLSIAAQREVDLVRLDRASPVLRMRVAKEGVVLMGKPREINAFRARAAIAYADLAPLLHRAQQRFLQRLRTGSRTTGTTP